MSIINTIGLKAKLSIEMTNSPDSCFPVRIIHNFTSHNYFSLTQILAPMRTPVSTRLLSGLLISFFSLQSLVAQSDTVTSSGDTIVNDYPVFNDETFNKGLINDPLALVRGRVPGLLLYRNGDDPNQNLDAMIGGPASFGTGFLPLVIIDGHPAIDFSSLDPNDIASITVLRTVAAAAKYGGRGTGGAIEILTKQASLDGWHAGYQGFLSSSSLDRRLPIATTEEFIGFRPGLDLGDETDWMNEITRTASSQVHNLSLSAKFGQTSLRASANYRDIEGIGITSGFTQWNGRLAVTQKAFKEKLTLGLNLATNNRDSEFGFVEAFRYARTFNPTAAVRLSPSDPNFETFGGYNQRINFDYYNPVAMLEQNTNLREQSTWLAGINANYEIIDGLTASVLFSRQVQETDGGQVYAKDSYWIGRSENGFVNRVEGRDENEVFEAALQFEKEIGKLDLSVRGGYAFQNFLIENIFTSGGDFTADEFTYQDVDQANDFVRGFGRRDSSIVGQRLTSGFVSGQFEFDGTYGLVTNLRYDVYKGLEEVYPNGFFPGVEGYIHLGNLLDLEFVSLAKIYAGVGETGAVTGIMLPSSVPVGSASENLSWERRRGMDLGINLELFDGKVFAQVEYYLHQTRDPIFYVAVPVPPNPSPFIVANIDDITIRNSGLNIVVGGEIEKGKFSWTPTLNLSIYTSGFDSTAIDNPAFRFFGSSQAFDFSSSPGDPGLTFDPSTVILRNGPFGNFWGLTYAGVSADGNYLFEDLDNDGIAGIDPNGNIDLDDESIIGEAIPDFSFGFYNRLSFANVELSFLLRGDVGHEMVNHYRIFYESLGSRPVDNLIITDYFDPELFATPIFNNNHVEDASYIALDFVSLGYTFTARKHKNRKLQIYLTGQNLLMVTEYSGIDPSFRWVESQTGSSFVSPGLDRRNNYPAAKTIGGGVKLSF